MLEALGRREPTPKFELPGIGLRTRVALLAVSAFSLIAAPSSARAEGQLSFARECETGPDGQPVTTIILDNPPRLIPGEDVEILIVTMKQGVIDIKTQIAFDPSNIRRLRVSSSGDSGPASAVALSKKEGSKSQEVLAEGVIESCTVEDLKNSPT